MKNLKELFTNIIELKQLARSRAHEYMMESGKNRSHYDVQFYKNGSVTFISDGVNVRFREDTSHDYPEYRGIELTIDQLEMSDDEWNEYISEVRAERDEKDRIKEEKEKKRILKQKREELKKLKEELGE